MEREIVTIKDDESSVPNADQKHGPHKGQDPAKKRKADSEDQGISEKVTWTDESDGPVTKPKKRRGKRKSVPKKRDASPKKGEENPDQDVALADIPDYLQERRNEFDASKKRYHDAALMLPPDYTGIDLDKSVDLNTLKERPEFDSRSGIKPSRPYRDIELPQSAGLIPASIAQYLRDYQVEAVRFLHRKFVYQEGAILGDDMGLGKSVMSAAWLSTVFGKTGDERDDKRLRKMRAFGDRWYPRVLIICPGSLIVNWRNELTRWGWWHIDLFHGPNKEDVLNTARSGLLEIMITTYDTYKNNRSSINMVQWDAIIADECHRLKDPLSETTKAMKEVNALCRIGLTGTAIQNRYEELWTLLDWTNPGHFGTHAEWTQMISKPLTVGQSHEATVAQLSLARQTANKLVNNLLPAYFLRRMKTLIAHQLPKKTDRVVFCPLTDVQKEAYENFLDSAEITLLRTLSDECEHGNKQGWCCKKRLPNGKAWQSYIFPSMIALQKLANHLTLLVPSTIDKDAKHMAELETLQLCMPETWRELYEKRDQIRNLVNAEFCGKWKVLKKLLRFWHSGGDKVLVFSHSVRLLRILQHLFTSTSYNVSYLDGSLTYEQRQEVVDTFNSDPTQFVFLISTKAGGVGLNITSANKVVIVDPHWNPAYDLQAQDRAYRIGQTRDVEVFRLISLGTVEEIVYARQIYKQQQANIGYTASSERRYFKGVQQDSERQGEIFGLSNIYTYHSDTGLLRDIVNKTNIAEAKAGVRLADVDMEQALKDDEGLGAIKDETTDSEDGGLGQLATLLTSRDQTKVLEARKASAPKSDAIHAILKSAGVEYTHDNSEVVGSSRIEEQLSRQAAMTSYTEGAIDGQSTLFTSSQERPLSGTLHSTYQPPEEVCHRQFCEMAKELGFQNATEFALVVENWTVEARRNCLDTFYQRREQRLADKEIAEEEKILDEDMNHDLAKYEMKDDIKHDIKQDIKHDVKNEAKDGIFKSEAKYDINHNIKSDTKSEMPEEKCPVKSEEPPFFKPEEGQKRTSIFIIDDDDDEL